jgi:tetratricopeptide (TPR) repeat protein
MVRAFKQGTCDVTRLMLSLTILLSGTILSPPALSLATGETPVQADIRPAGSIEGNFIAAYIAGSTQDAGSAAIFYRELLKSQPHQAEFQERAFLAFLANGEMQEVFRMARLLVNRDKSHTLARLTLGVEAIAKGQFQIAKSLLKERGRGRGADLAATLLNGWSHAGVGERQGAYRTFARVTNERQFSAFGHYHAGLAASVMGDIQETARHLGAAYQSDKDTLRMLEAFARFESGQKRNSEALAMVEAFDSTAPGHPLVTDLLRRLKAGETLSPLITSAKAGAAEVLYGLGAAGNAQGDELPAILYLRLALYLQPDHTLALATLADVHDRLKQGEKSLDALRRIPVGSPLRLTADIQIAMGLEQLGRGDEALAHIEAVIRAHPDNPEALGAHGNLLRTRKRFPEAAEAYSLALAKAGLSKPAHWTLYYFRGASHERAKQWPKAESDLKKALELIPESLTQGRAQVLNYLGYSWVDQNLNLDEAFRMLKQAVALSPRDGMILDSLGWAYYRLGRYDEAVIELEKAVELKPGDPVINDHLGDAYWKTGRKLEARFQWQHAKDSQPEAEDLARILHKLEHGLDSQPNPAAAETPPKHNGG